MILVAHANSMRVPFDEKRVVDVIDGQMNIVIIMAFAKNQGFYLLLEQLS